MIDINYYRDLGWYMEVNEDGDLEYKSPRMHRIVNSFSYVEDMTVEHLLKEERKVYINHLHKETVRVYSDTLFNGLLKTIPLWSEDIGQELEEE